MVSSHLSEARYNVTSVPDYPQAVSKINEVRPDLVIVDEKLPDRDGRDVCSDISNNYGIPSILLTGNVTGIDARQTETASGITLFLKQQPFGYLELLSMVKLILRHTRQKSGGNKKSGN